MRVVAGVGGALVTDRFELPDTAASAIPLLASADTLLPAGLIVLGVVIPVLSVAGRARPREG